MLKPRVVLLTALCATLSVACAHTGLPSAQPGEPMFDGEWRVQWCDRSRPDLECGGFGLVLVERDGRICGTYYGSRINVSQLDEGADRAVRGSSDGRIAELTIESERSGNVYAATASVSDLALSWKVIRTLRETNRDIDIIAMDERLERLPKPFSDAYLRAVEECAVMLKAS